METLDKPSGANRISLVLGSGGARGLAHIGVIRWLEQHGYQIKSIVGCSMGACVGGIHAISKLDAYEEWVRAIRKRDIMALLDLSIRRGGLVKGDRLFNTLRGLLGEKMIENLPIRFTAVAVDLNKSREVWITRGPVFDAIRASSSIPFLFTPMELGGRRLIDGGVINPVPIAPAMSDDTDIVVAVNASGEPTREPHLEPKTAPTEKRNSFQERISQFLEGLGQSESTDHAGDESITDVVYTAFDAMQGTIARQKIAAYPPDVLIEIPRNSAGMMEFNRADVLIDLGYAATEKAMSDWLGKYRPGSRRKAADQQQ